MKCEIAKDLMTLYVEGMCSEEAKKELEVHLKECSNCANQLEELQKELNDAGLAKKADYTQENKKQLKPMKKVKKSLFRRKLVAVILGLLLIVVLLVVGQLSYGQMTNRGMSFSALADAARLKGVCESLAEGDSQELLDVMAFRIEDIYQIRYENSLHKSFEDYKAVVKQSMDETSAYYFGGKDIEVKVEEIWLSPYDENTADNMATTLIIIGFYEKEELIYTLEFGKVSPKKFIVYEQVEENAPTFVANLLPYDDVILEITLRHATTRQYESLRAGETTDRYGNGFQMIVEKNGTEEEKAAYKEGMKKRLKELYTSEWYFKEVLFAPEEFDVEKERWIYKVWFQVEDQETGNIAVLEQRFIYYNSDLYIMEDEEPAIMATNGEIPEAIEKQLLGLFR